MNNIIYNHKRRHIFLHKALDELFADYIQHHPGEINLTKFLLMELVNWSYEQSANPTEREVDTFATECKRHVNKAKTW